MPLLEYDVGDTARFIDDFVAGGIWKFYLLLAEWVLFKFEITVKIL